MRGGLLVCGTGSDAGKSFVVTGLCRLLASQGVRNIDQYNRKVRQNENKPLNLFEDAEGAEELQPLPYILILIDELGTPDSSRYWEVAKYRIEGPQVSLDKQYVRDWLRNHGWNREPPAPALPPEVVQKTSEKYLDAYKRVTRRDLLAELPPLGV